MTNHPSDIYSISIHMDGTAPNCGAVQSKKQGEAMKNRYAFVSDEKGVVCAECVWEDSIENGGETGAMVNVEDAYPDGFTCTECCEIVMPTMTNLSPDQQKIARSVRGHHAIHANMGSELSLGEQIVSAQVVLGIAYSFSDEWNDDTARAFLSVCGFSDEVIQRLIMSDQPDAWY